MVSIQSLNLEFKRVLIESKHTKLIDEFEPSFANKLKLLTGNEQDDLVVASYLSDECWLAVGLSSIYWMDDEGMNTVAIDSIAEAKLDLLVNKELGFDSAYGFKYLTLITKNGEKHHIEAEPRSSLEAVLAVIVKLIKPH